MRPATAHSHVTEGGGDSGVHIKARRDTRAHTAHENFHKHLQGTHLSAARPLPTADQVSFCADSEVCERWISCLSRPCTRHGVCHWRTKNNIFAPCSTRRANRLARTPGGGDVRAGSGARPGRGILPALAALVLYSAKGNEVATELSSPMRSRRAAPSTIRASSAEAPGLALMRVRDRSELAPGAFGILEPEAAARRGRSRGAQQLHDGRAGGGVFAAGRAPGTRRGSL